MACHDAWNNPCIIFYSMMQGCLGCAFGMHHGPWCVPYILCFFLWFFPGLNNERKKGTHFLSLGNTFWEGKPDQKLWTYFYYVWAALFSLGTSCLLQSPLPVHHRLMSNTLLKFTSHQCFIHYFFLFYIFFTLSLLLNNIHSVFY